MLIEALKIALSEYGNTAIKGPKSNSEILKYYKQIGFSWVSDDDLAWCAGFLGYCLKNAKMAFLKTLHARDYLNYGEKAIVPKLGDIVILWRVKKESIFGHVGFYIKETQTGIYILGGNQANSVSIQQYPKSQVLDIRTS